MNHDSGDVSVLRNSSSYFYADSSFVLDQHSRQIDCPAADRGIVGAVPKQKRIAGQLVDDCGASVKTHWQHSVEDDVGNGIGQWPEVLLCLIHLDDGAGDRLYSAADRNHEQQHGARGEVRVARVQVVVGRGHSEVKGIVELPRDSSRHGTVRDSVEPGCWD